VRIALLSKPLVNGAYQTKCEALAALPGVDLLVIVPPSWREIGAWEQPLERRFTAGYRLVCTPIAFNGHHHVHFYPRLGPLLSDFRPEVFHVDEEAFNFATFHAMWLGRRLGARMAFYTWANIHRRLPPPFSLFERACFAWSGRAFAGNRAAEAILRAKGYRQPIDVLPQFGVEPALFHPATAPVAHQYTIGYVGRLVEPKGVHVLLRALAGLRGDWRAVIAGEGEQRPALAALAADLGLAERVCFAGRVAGDAVPDFYRGLDVLAVPSLTTPTWKEQFGRVIIEAMACQVAVVGSDSGEIPHVIGDGGLVTPEGDPAALAAALQRLLDDPAERARLAAAGRARVLAHYTQASLARQYYDAYQALLHPQGDHDEEAG
jgi:glycosyltransferase involved in cell wall biosynthesis